MQVSVGPGQFAVISPTPAPLLLHGRASPGLSLACCKILIFILFYQYAFPLHLVEVVPVFKVMKGTESTMRALPIVQTRALCAK